MRGTEVSEFIDSAYTWQERATKAEAEVERLQKVYSITNESWQKIQAENALLRKVVDAAREFVSSTGCNPKECGKCDPKYIGFCRWSGIGQAFAELDKEGER